MVTVNPISRKRPDSYLGTDGGRWLGRGNATGGGFQVFVG